MVNRHLTVLYRFRYFAIVFKCVTIQAGIQSAHPSRSIYPFPARPIC